MVLLDKIFVSFLNNLAMNFLFFLISFHNQLCFIFRQILNEFFTDIFSSHFLVFRPNFFFLSRHGQRLLQLPFSPTIGDDLRFGGIRRSSFLFFLKFEFKLRIHNVRSWIRTLLRRRIVLTRQRRASQQVKLHSF